MTTFLPHLCHILHSLNQAPEIQLHLQHTVIFYMCHVNIAHRQYLRFIWFSEYAVVISLNNINKLVFVMEIPSVYTRYELNFYTLFREALRFTRLYPLESWQNLFGHVWQYASQKHLYTPAQWPLTWACKYIFWVLYFVLSQTNYRFWYTETSVNNTHYQ
jgi:hypothetical protein